jgi:hypothetical protein
VLSLTAIESGDRVRPEGLPPAPTPPGASGRGADARCQSSPRLRIDRAEEGVTRLTIGNRGLEELGEDRVPRFPHCGPLGPGARGNRLAPPMALSVRTPARRHSAQTVGRPLIPEPGL